jgi:hypothetical protein
MLKYENPGEVRIPRNYKCCHCGMVIRTPQGINNHLKQKHNIAVENIKYKQDWQLTMKTACPSKSLPVRNR